MNTLILVVGIENIGNLQKEDIEVSLNEEIPMNIISLGENEDDDEIMDIIVRFPAAPTGEYELIMFHETHGYFENRESFEVGGLVLEFSPTYGSIYGGTLITIEGENFSDLESSNQVMVGNYFCELESFSSTELICRLEAISYDSSYEVPDEIETELKVHLKVVEQAICDDGDDCVFTFEIEQTPVVQDIQWIEVDGQQLVQLTGDKFDLADELEQVVVLIEDQIQEVIQYSQTQIIFKLTQIQTLGNLQVVLRIDNVGYALFECSGIFFLFFLILCRYS